MAPSAHGSHNPWSITTSAHIWYPKMPSAVPELPKWQRPQKTKQDLPWADIKVLDLSKFGEPDGKQELAEELRQAVCKCIWCYTADLLTFWVFHLGT